MFTRRNKAQTHAQINFLLSSSSVRSMRLYPSLPGSGMLSAMVAVLLLRCLGAG